MIATSAPSIAIHPRNDDLPHIVVNAYMDAVIRCSAYLEPICTKSRLNPSPVAQLLLPLATLQQE